MITKDYLELIPAYGRDYKNQAEVELAFRQGKDFELASLGYGGKYCSMVDFAQGTKVNIRFAKLRKVHVVTV